MAKDDKKLPFLKSDKPNSDKEKSPRDKVQPFEKFLKKNRTPTFYEEPKKGKSFTSDDKPKYKDQNDGEERKPWNKDKSEGRGNDFGKNQRPNSKFSDDRPSREDRPKRDFGDKPWTKDRPSRDDRPKREFNDKPWAKEGSERQSDKPKRDIGDKPWKERSNDRSNSDDRPPFDKDRGPRKDFKGGDSFGNKREYTKGPFGEKKDFSRDKPYSDNKESSFPKKTYNKPKSTDTEAYNEFSEFFFGNDAQKEETKRPKREAKATDKKPTLFNDRYGETDESANDKRSKKPRIKVNPKSESDEPSITRLNKFVAQAGVCSRRKAAELVKNGEISVNGVVEINPAYETKDSDVITYEGKVLKKEQKLVYLLMNKPKGFITTLDDERERKTVMDLIKDKTTERIYPVGRLDRGTTGLLLLTNDGELTARLSHPSFNVKKFYHVFLDKKVTKEDLTTILAGIELEDGIAEVDAVGYVDGQPHNEVGIEIHSGKNRIVRRIFESLGYEVERLDRTYYAGLTKKDLPRGWSRHLTKQEVIMLKHFT